jgi:hypothetical protein
MSMEALTRLHKEFLDKAAYYEDHPYFPAYCMNATAKAYHEAAAMVRHEMEALNDESIEKVRSGEQADPRPNGAAPAPRSLPGGGETTQGSSGQEEG